MLRGTVGHDKDLSEHGFFLPGIPLPSRQPQCCIWNTGLSESFRESSRWEAMQRQDFHEALRLFLEVEHLPSLLTLTATFRPASASLRDRVARLGGPERNVLLHLQSPCSGSSSKGQCEVTLGPICCHAHKACDLETHIAWDSIMVCGLGSHTGHRAWEFPVHRKRRCCRLSILMISGHQVQ